MKVQVQYEFTREKIEELISQGFQGGSYWLKFHSQSPAPVMDGGFMILSDQEGEVTVCFNLNRIELGLKVMALKHPEHFADIICGDNDNDTGDIFLQCCMFENIIYG
jgi:hypothetical protein